MTKNSSTCLLIISKRFYSLAANIQHALESKGYIVKVANDEYPEGPIGKILGKLHILILRPMTEYVISKRYLQNKTYDIIIIIKGRGVDRSLMHKLRASSKRVIGYTWDSFKYNKAPLRWYKETDRFSTFDYKDGDKYNIPVVELYSAAPPLTEEKQVHYELSAIFRNHSGRIKYLDKILCILNIQATYIYIYEQNIFFFIANFLSNPRLYPQYLRNIHIRPLQYDAYMEKLKLSRFTLDYAHPYQTGITIRSFEALSAKTMIISNNPYMERSKYFNRSNTIIFTKQDKNDTLTVSYNTLKVSQPDFKIRSISDFIDDLVRA